MADGLSERDLELQQVMSELSLVVQDKSVQDKIGSIIMNHFILKQDVEDRIVKVAVLLKMWECESSDYNLEEQQRLINLVNEQFGDLIN